MKIYYTISFQDDILTFENAFQMLQGCHPSQEVHERKNTKNTKMPESPIAAIIFPLVFFVRFVVSPFGCPRPRRSDDSPALLSVGFAD